MKKLLTLSLILTVLGFTKAQDFLSPFDAIAPKKLSYVTDANGNETAGYIKSVVRVKGLITDLNMKLEDDSKKTVASTEVEYAFLPQNKLEKFGSNMSFATDATRWGQKQVDRVKDGYAYFEKTQIELKKGTETTLMQLLNPGATILKAYHDPFANETMSFAPGGIKVAGGEDKSYYMRKNDGVGYKVSKANFKENFETLFGDCPAFMEKYPKADWGEFEKMVFFYNDNCGK